MKNVVDRERGRLVCAPGSGDPDGQDTAAVDDSGGDARDRGLGANVLK